MDRYGGDFYRRQMMRYGGEYQQWGGLPRYDREFGYRGDRSGRFYDRDFSGYEQGGYAYRPAPRYDRGYMDRGRGFNQQRFRPQYDQTSDQSYWYGMRDNRGYPSPWDESGPGHYRFGLGYGQGRGQFIYK